MSSEDPEAITFYKPGEYLYAHSVLENVIFGHLRTEHAQTNERIRQNVVDLLAEAALLDDVREVGLEFAVGSKGDRLSGGQKQKIGMARALLKDPNILILDEATASLDNTSQARIAAPVEFRTQRQTYADRRGASPGDGSGLSI